MVLLHNEPHEKDVLSILELMDSHQGKTIHFLGSSLFEFWLAKGSSNLISKLDKECLS